MAENGNLNKMIETALANIKEISDVNTVIGAPTTVSGGTTVIPVSKVSMGFTSGGVDYVSKNAPDKNVNFGGGVGSGFSVVPVAFLVVDKDGNVSLINVDNPTGAGDDKLLGTISGIVDKAPSIIDKIVKIFKKKKDGNEKEEENTDNTEEGGSVILTNEDVEKMNSGEQNADTASGN